MSEATEKQFIRDLQAPLEADPVFLDSRRQGERIAELERKNAVLRGALIEAVDAALDDDGKWIDRNGDYVPALNRTNEAR